MADADEVFERVRTSFDLQGAMQTIGARLVRASAGEVEVALDYGPGVTQHHGFVHGGILVAALDTACGLAACTLMPPEAEPLTIELKHNFLAPARGERFTMVGRVRKAGRTVTFCDGETYAHEGGGTKLIATMSTTIMTVIGRDSVRRRQAP